MKIRLKDNNMIVLPQPKEVAFGELKTRQSFQEIRDNLTESHVVSDILIDIRNIYAISFLGLRWLYKLILEIRTLGYNPYLIVCGALKPVLKQTKIGKLIEIHSSFIFEKDNFDSVMDLEKDLLWNSINKGFVNE